MPIQDLYSPDIGNTPPGGMDQDILSQVIAAALGQKPLAVNNTTGQDTGELLRQVIMQGLQQQAPQATMQQRPANAAPRYYSIGKRPGDLPNEAAADYMRTPLRTTPGAPFQDIGGMSDFIGATKGSPPRLLEEMIGNALGIDSPYVQARKLQIEANRPQMEANQIERQRRNDLLEQGNATKDEQAKTNDENRKLSVLNAISQNYGKQLGAAMADPRMAKTPYAKDLQTRYDAVNKQIDALMEGIVNKGGTSSKTGTGAEHKVGFEPLGNTTPAQPNTQQLVQIYQQLKAQLTQAGTNSRSVMGGGQGDKSSTISALKVVKDALTRQGIDPDLLDAGIMPGAGQGQGSAPQQGNQPTVRRVR